MPGKKKSAAEDEGKNMRRRAKIDDNHNQTVRALRKLGLSVLSLAPMGRGCPDILVGSHGENYLFEIKDESKTASKRKLTADEEKFAASWRGQTSVIGNWQEALKIINP